MSMGLPEPVRFSAFIRAIRVGARTLDDLLVFRRTSAVHRDIVDNHVIDVWARVLTEDDIVNAFDGGFTQEYLEGFGVDVVYVVAKAFDARDWYLSRDMKPSYEPAVAEYDFDRAIIKNRFGDIDDYLVDKGIIDSTDTHGNNALMYTAFMGSMYGGVYKTRLHRLLSLGVFGVDDQNRDGWTTLMFASVPYEEIVRYGGGAKGIDMDPAVVNALIDAGADVDIADRIGNTAFDYAIGEEPPDETFSVLNEFADENLRGWFNIRVKTSIGIAKALVKATKNINRRLNGSTMLSKAVNADQYEISNAIIDAGANVNDTASMGALLRAYSEAINDDNPDDALIDEIHDTITNMLAHGYNVMLLAPDGESMANLIDDPEVLRKFIDRASDPKAFANGPPGKRKPLFSVFIEYRNIANADMKKRAEEVGYILLENSAAPLAKEDISDAFRMDPTDAFENALFGRDANADHMKLVDVDTAIRRGNDRDIASASVFDPQKFSTEQMIEIAEAIGIDPHIEIAKLLANLRNQKLNLRPPSMPTKSKP